MPRRAREKSATGIYHVMLRGINRQQIFLDEEDYRKFLYTLSDYKKVCGYQLFAYCLMPNHIHLLIQQCDETLEQIFKRICGKFVYWYNAKYQRVGHLFQDRFRSEPVNTDPYFLTVLRYVHQNPRKAGLCQELSAYPYSSYNGYGTNLLIDSDFTYGILDKEEFAEFHKADVHENCLDITETVTMRLTDDQVCKRLLSYAGCSTMEAFREIQESEKRSCIKRLKQDGAAANQIARLTGLSYYFVYTII